MDNVQIFGPELNAAAADIFKACFAETGQGQAKQHGLKPAIETYRFASQYEHQHDSNILVRTGALILSVRTGMGTLDPVSGAWIVVPGDAGPIIDFEDRYGRDFVRGPVVPSAGEIIDVTGIEGPWIQQAREAIPAMQDAVEYFRAEVQELERQVKQDAEDARSAQIERARQAALATTPIIGGSVGGGLDAGE